jgi:predicted RNase H-like nuclease
VPCGTKWLVAAGRLQGVTLSCADPELFGSLIEILDYRPSFEVIALGCNIGLPTKPGQGGRTCDREARRLLGFSRGGAIFSAPARVAIKATTYDDAYRLNDGMGSAAYNILPRIAEVDDAIEPYWQRTVFEVHPELSFYQLNDDVPMHHAKRTHHGQNERRALLERRMQGVRQIIDARVRGARRHHLFDAAATLWTARRIAGRVVNRVPEDPEWDDKGLRMEIVR